MGKARKFEVGQRVWQFDENRRVYRKAPEGELWDKSGPIHAEHFRPCVVTGLDERCYLIADDPLPAWAKPDRVAFAKAERLYRTDAEKDDDCWAKDHRHRLIDRMWRVDAATLRKVAEAIGYIPEED